jgi:flagellar assembly protein FliH
MSSSSSGGAIFRGARFSRSAVLVTKTDGSADARSAAEGRLSTSGAAGLAPDATVAIAGPADDRMAQAVTEAAGLISKARSEAEVLTNSARQAGYQEGFAEGRRAGYQEGAAVARGDVERQMEAEVSRLRQLADNAVSDRVEMLQSVESQVVHLALAVASRIVQREVSLDESVVLRTVRAALRTAADATTARVRLHPLDRDFLTANWPREMERDGRRCELVQDESIQRGGCVVESGSGSVDARIATQLADVEEALVG